MEKTAIFTITENKGHYNIKSKQYNLYNRIGISKNHLFFTMYQLSDVFNNVLNIKILFEIE